MQSLNNRAAAPQPPDRGLAHLWRRNCAIRSGGALRGGPPRWRGLALVLTVGTTMLVAASPAVAPVAAQPAPPTWAPAAEASIHPGVQTLTENGQCTANFVFHDAAGEVDLGQAAHCGSSGNSNDTNGCETAGAGAGTEVEIDGATQPGVLVYSSWEAMKAAGETDHSVCHANDFALIRIAEADRASVNPSLPFFGGPEGITPTVADGADVHTFGNSSLRPGNGSAKSGTKQQLEADGWTHRVLTLSNPGVLGDSGSAFIGPEGNAFGVLSTVSLFPSAGSNGVSDLTLMLAYMAAQGGPDVELALGTLIFNGGEEATEEREIGDPGPPDPVDPGAASVTRLSGPPGTSRIETAVAVSQDRYPDGDASAVVLARADVAADALAGTPLAAARSGPLLLTQSTSLHPATRAEIDRQLGPGGVVLLLGGTAAIDAAVEQELLLSGYQVRRVEGDTRIETALAIAELVTDAPSHTFLADAYTFADALVSGPAAAALGGGVLLTDGASAHPAVDSYLAEQAAATRVAVGATAAAAYPDALAIAGDDDEATSVAVAETFLPQASAVGIARVDVFADALAGGAHIAAAGGPLLLTPSDALSPVVGAHLSAGADRITAAVLYGGEAALSAAVADQVADALA